ncbi:cytochrome ubiquinol oxidase subunit I, partial [Staphylococcus xylosus]
VMGGVTGVMQASAPADYQLHDSYFIVAPFHYVIVGGVVFALLAGLHYWFPLLAGKMLGDKLGKVTFWLFCIGFHLTVLIQHFLGLWGMPRRVFTYLPGQGYDIPNLVSTIGALFMAVAVITEVINVIMTLAKGEKVGKDAWGDGRTLEWALPVPTPHY